MGAFGGSYLNHQFLISGRTPEFFNAAETPAKKKIAVLEDGPVIERHARFPQRVNAGFLQIVSRREVKLRVYERGAGETLACGTGACAAAVAGILRGRLQSPVAVETRGGTLTIAWHGGDNAVWMKGPARTVFEGHVEI